MQKNVASQKWIVFAFEGEGGTNPGNPVTGDAANITANIRIDGGAANAVDDTNPTELEDGYYVFDITAAESNGDLLLIAPASSTANVIVIGVPGAVWTTPANFPDLGIESDGDLTKVNTLNGHTAQTGDTFAQLPTNFSDLSITATTGRVDVASIEGSDATDQINAACDTALTDYDAVVPADLPTNFGSMGIEADGHVHADVKEWVGTAVTVSSTSAKPEVDMFSISDIASAADRMEAWANGWTTGTVEGTPSTTVFDSDVSETTDNHFNNMVISFTGGNLLGQARRIADYDGTAGTFTVQPALTEAPSVGDTFIIIPIVAYALDENGRTDVGSWLGTAVTVGNGAPDVNIASTDDIDLSATQKASVNAEADTAISDAALATAAALTTVDTVVDAIKAKTDSLTFTQANVVDANITYVNETEVGGTGASGDEWGPA